MRRKRIKMTFDLPSEVRRMIREEARAQGMTISNFLWDLIRKDIVRKRQIKGTADF